MGRKRNNGLSGEKRNIIEAENCDHGIYLRGIDGVRISGNRITCQKEPIVIEDCSIVE